MFEKKKPQKVAFGNALGAKLFAKDTQNTKSNISIPSQVSQVIGSASKSMHGYE